VVITLHNTTNGLPYIIEAATNLLGPWFTNQTLLATNITPPNSNSNMVAQPIAIEAYQGVFFRALQATPGELRWKVQLANPATGTADAFGGGLDAAPSLSPDGETVYMTTPNRAIAAVDAMTGMIVWADTIFTPNTNVNPQPAEFTGSAAVTASNIYVGSCDGYLYCLNATNGHTNWAKSMGAYTAVYGTPAIDASGRILVPSDETQSERAGNPITGLTCLNPANGSTAWFFQPQDLHNTPASGRINNAGDIDSSVAVGNNGTIYFLAEGWRLYSLDPTGKLNFFLPVPGDTEPDSAVAIDRFGRILVGSDSDYIYCVNTDGSLEWIFNVYLQTGGNDTGPMECSPTIDAAGNLYTGSAGDGAVSLGYLYSFDSVGVTNWFTNTSAGTVISSPAVGETALYFGSTNGLFIALNPSNQAIIWSYTNTQPIISSPMICPDGSVIYGCEDGFLYCFWGSSLPAGANAPWPTFHGNNQRTGLQPGTNTLATNNGAPFVCDATNNGDGNFTFEIIGSTNGTWTVYSSTNLSNWTRFMTNVTLHAPSGNPTAPGSNTITDSGVLNVPQKFYQLSNSACCSRAIGFTSLMIQRGTNLVANQLCQVDDSIMVYFAASGYPMNTLNTIFNLYLWATNMGSTDMYKWNGNGFDEQINYSSGGQPSWIEAVGSSQSGDMTMLPGTSVILYNPSSESYPIWFTGLVRNQQVFSLEKGTNYLSATAPIAGSITTITGYVPHNGDVVKLWNTTTSNYVSHTYTSNSWGTNGVPMLSVGQGFVLVSSNAYVWTNTWKTGVCGPP
jgi:outer membrane protein assembly factor BamB